MHRGKYMSFEVAGDSMNSGDPKDAIIDGSVVTGRFIDPSLWNSRFHIHMWKDYVIVHNDGVIIKRITHHDVDKHIIACQSLNPDKDRYPDFQLDLAEVKQIFNIIGVYKVRK
jgi:hypothetical protein